MKTQNKGKRRVSKIFFLPFDGFGKSSVEPLPKDQGGYITDFDYVIRLNNL